LRRLAPFFLAVAAILVVATATSADDGVVQKASVTPRQGFTDSVDGVRIQFRVAGSTQEDVTIEISGSGRTVREIPDPGVKPGVDETVKWDGLTNDGRLVPDGTYRVTIHLSGGAQKDAGSVDLHRHLFPVRGPHGTRGAVGRFHAPRNGGRRHQGFDVTGRCGTPLAAAVTGTVTRNHFDPRLDGNFVVIKELGSPYQYLYAHMVRRSPFKRGDFVHVGQIVGHIGRTGNAASTPCHLHFEVHLRGKPINPKPFLRAWDRYS
jgi:murein DD-endopeptidase MepM/ murein hydrolase activator NlpD